MDWNRPTSMCNASVGTMDATNSPTQIQPEHVQVTMDVDDPKAEAIARLT